MPLMFSRRVLGNDEGVSAGRSLPSKGMGQEVSMREAREKKKTYRGGQGRVWRQGCRDNW